MVKHEIKLTKVGRHFADINYLTLNKSLITSNFNCTLIHFLSFLIPDPWSLIFQNQNLFKNWTDVNRIIISRYLANDTCPPGVYFQGMLCSCSSFAWRAHLRSNSQTVTRLIAWTRATLQSTDALNCTHVLRKVQSCQRENTWPESSVRMNNIGCLER